MSQFWIVLALGCALGNHISSAADLPEFIHPCHRSDPNLNQCIIDAVHDLRPVLAAGNEEFSIPAVEPLYIGDLLLSEKTQTTGNGLKISAKKIYALGGSNYKITKLKMNYEEMISNFEIDLPVIQMTGRYQVDGRILLLPIKGDGNMVGNFTNCKADIVLRGEFFNKDGAEYIRYVKMSMKIKVGKGRLRLDGLFGGDKVLGDLINDTINANFDLLSKDVIPLIEKALSKVFLDAANKIVGRFTSNQLFLS